LARDGSLVETFFEIFYILKVIIEKKNDAISKSAPNDLKFSQLIEIGKINIQAESKPILTIIKRCKGFWNLSIFAGIVS